MRKLLGEACVDFSEKRARQRHMRFLELECDEIFRTPAGIGYDLLEYVPVEKRPKGFEAAANFHTVVGRMDMHWSANTHVKVYIRVILHDTEREISGIVFKAAIMELLEIHGLSTSTFSAECLRGEMCSVVENRVDERGVSDCTS